MLAFLLTSGLAFFVGIALIGLGVIGFAIAKHRELTRVHWLSWLLTVLALFLIALSSTPLSWLFYVAATVVSAAWLFENLGLKESSRGRRRWLRDGLIFVWGTGAILELLHQLPSKFPRPLWEPTVLVIGDRLSVSDEAETAWPDQLPHFKHTVNLAEATATTESAWSQARKLSPEGEKIVVIEIGWNDLQSSVSPEKFQADLDRLLESVSGSRRIVIMFELPLPPWHHRWGEIQRRLASKHQVVLIPKRMLATIVTTPGTINASGQLSPQGHLLMAQLVEELASKGVVSK